MRILLVATAIVLAAASALAQGRVYVTPSGTGGGGSWAEATGDLAGAMATAVTGTEIWVAQGTYTPVTCLGVCDEADRAVSFRLRPGVRLTGGFVGGETDASTADPANVTVLSGDIGAAGDPSDNSFNVLYCDGCGDAASVANVTISGGRADRPNRNITQRGRAGAGVYLDASAGRLASPTFIDCAVVDNDAFGQGGGLYFNGFDGGDASPTFERCLIAFNTARADGGGFYALALDGESSPSFADSRLRNNGTINPGNSSGQSGAAGYAQATNGVAAITLDRCLVTRNSADISTPGYNNGNASANGGAFYLTSGQPNPSLRLTVRNSVLSHNSSYSGAAVYNNRGHVVFTNVSVVANQALGSGGSGAGLYINGGTAEVSNGLSYGNRVPNNPGAGRDFRFVNGALDVSYTLLESATRAEAFSCSKPDCANDRFTAGAGMLFGRDPMLVDVSADVPRLQATSPAIDAGLAERASTSGGDYFGAERIANRSVDLGAVERDAGPLPVELLNFGAAPTDGGAIRVTWASASEVDLANYRVLRSETGDADDFAVIGDVLAMGSGEYAHLDRATIPGATYYYRLRSVDLDGTTYESAVVTAVATPARPTLPHLFTEVYPNPTSGEVHVRLAPRDNARTVYATLFDAAGRKLRLWPLTTDGEHVLSLREFEGGRYVLRLTEGGREQSATLLLHH